LHRAEGLEREDALARFAGRLDRFAFASTAETVSAAIPRANRSGDRLGTTGSGSSPVGSSPSVSNGNSGVGDDPQSGGTGGGGGKKEKEDQTGKTASIKKREVNM